MFYLLIFNHACHYVIHKACKNVSLIQEMFVSLRFNSEKI